MSDPTPTPAPRPRPHITVALPSLQTVWLSLITGLLVWQMFFHGQVLPPTPPAPAFSAVTAGRAYGTDLSHTYAEALSTAAQSIRAGGALGAAQAALKADWTAAHEKAFATRFGAALTAIIAEGKEPETPAQRLAFAGFLDQIARGAKEVK